MQAEILETAAQERTHAAGPRPPVAVFAGVEGVLLDDDYISGASRAAIARLHDAGALVIPVTGMSLGEFDAIARDLGMHGPMIVEAGGAIARPGGGGWDVEPCGPPGEILLDAIREIEDRCGAELIVCSAEPCGAFAGAGAYVRGAGDRAFSEPFLIETGDLADVRRAAASIGFSVRRSGAFFHLLRASEESAAFLRLRDQLRCELVIGVGASPLDAQFVRRSDIPIVVPRSDGTPDPELLAALRTPRIAPASGPAGWAAVVDELCESLFPKRRARRSET
jgi:predicted mannosyl-3-phosphoglycerate phosphatase (HAD superfamily)